MTCHGARMPTQLVAVVAAKHTEACVAWDRRNKPLAAAIAEGLKHAPIHCRCRQALGAAELEALVLLATTYPEGPDALLHSRALSVNGCSASMVACHVAAMAAAAPEAAAASPPAVRLLQRAVVVTVCLRLAMQAGA